MMKNYFMVFLSGVTIVIAGCAASGVATFSTVPPSESVVQNEVYVNKPFSEVWDNLVGELAKSFFVINNIEKESQIINVSFSTNNPELYIDCGSSHRTYSRGSGKKEYTYKIAESSSYKSTKQQGAVTYIYNVNRSTSLEGRINIFVAPEKEGTKVRVNVRYIFTAKASGTYTAENIFGVPVQQGQIPPQSPNVSFSTNEPNKTNWGTPSQPLYITCYSTGKLEEDILRMVK